MVPRGRRRAVRRSRPPVGLAVRVPDGAPSAPRYPIPAGRHRVEHVIDRSRFLCTLGPVSSVDEAQAFVREISREFPDATHHCWAYVVGAPGSSDRIGLSDDGEPHGTAGRPMFTVLQHSGVGDLAAVVTRYYGGVKLGTGGLVKAYGGVVQDALAAMPRVMRVTRLALLVTIDYAAISAVKQRLPEFEVELLDEQYGVDVRMHLRCPEEHAARLRQVLLDVTRGQAVVEEAADSQ